MLRPPLAAALVAFTIQAACGSPSLVGEWEASSENAEGSSFIFREDGTALWLLPDTFRIRYRADFDSTPHTLDLSGFEEGPLRGYLLYCIFDFQDDDILRLDCEPGVASDRGAGIRPDAFGAQQTQIFARLGVEGS